MCLTLNVQNFLNPKGGCMKKLVVLALVLSVASMASAALQLTGAPVAPIAIGDTVSAGILSDAVMQYQSGNYFVVAATDGILSVDNMSGAVVCTDSGMSLFQGVSIPADTGWVLNVAGVTGMTGGAFNMDATTGLAAQTLFSGINITGAAKGDGIVYLLISPDLSDGSWTTAASFAVHVTPEPITMTLLGLGGLFLRRRK
jgi:hypothetical protein